MNRRGWIFLGILVILIMLSFYFDSGITRGIASIRSNLLNDFFLGITFISSEVIIFFVLTSLFLWQEHKRKWILPLWLTLGLSAIISFALKIAVHRQRPFQLGIVSVLPFLEETNFLTWNFSFPSFQAMLAFCAIPILSREFPKFKYIWVVFAGLVAFSRVYFGLHFLSDVFVGGVVGYLIGMIVVKIETKNKLWERIYRKVF